jgi:methyl-accepting chemotaxis protein
MTDQDTDAKSFAEVHAEILRLADEIGARLDRIEKLIEEIRETIARAAERSSRPD